MHIRSTSKAVAEERSLIRMEISWFGLWAVSEIEPEGVRKRWSHGFSNGSGMFKRRNKLTSHVSFVTISWVTFRGKGGV